MLSLPQRAHFGFPQEQLFWFPVVLLPPAHEAKASREAGVPLPFVLLFSQSSPGAVFQIKVENGRKQARRVCWNQSCIKIHRTYLSEPAVMWETNHHERSLRGEAYSSAYEKVPLWSMEPTKGDSSHLFLHWFTRSCNISTSLLLKGSCLRNRKHLLFPLLPLLLPWILW